MTDDCRVCRLARRAKRRAAYHSHRCRPRVRWRTVSEVQIWCAIDGSAPDWHTEVRTGRYGTHFAAPNRLVRATWSRFYRIGTRGMAVAVPVYRAVNDALAMLFRAHEMQVSSEWRAVRVWAEEVARARLVHYAQEKARLRWKK